MGYSHVSEGYRILNPILQQVHVSGSIKFDDNGFWDWEIMGVGIPAHETTEEDINPEPTIC